jgi:hypothetical protein
MLQNNMRPSPGNIAAYLHQATLVLVASIIYYGIYKKCSHRFNAQTNKKLQRVM